MAMAENTNAESSDANIRHANPQPEGPSGALVKLARTLGVSGLVLGVNPLAAHAVAYAGGPAFMAYVFAAIVILLFIPWYLMEIRASAKRPDTKASPAA